MRPRPVHISFLKESRDALPYRHCSFHVVNRPQLGLPIEILYSSRANRICLLQGALRSQRPRLQDSAMAPADYRSAAPGSAL